MSKAVENKHKSCGSTFYNLAEGELSHANHLLRTFRTVEKPETVTDADYSAMMKFILDAYSEDMGKFEAMKKVYWSE